MSKNPVTTQGIKPARNPNVTAKHFILVFDEKRDEWYYEYETYVHKRTGIKHTYYAPKDKDFLLPEKILTAFIKDQENGGDGIAVAFWNQIDRDDPGKGEDLEIIHIEMNENDFYTYKTARKTIASTNSDSPFGRLFDLGDKSDE